MNQGNEFEERNDLQDIDEEKYLLFRLGSELYGTPLLGVREVVEPQGVKQIPNTVSYFKGVINIRGQIVGLVDLRVRFGYGAEKGPSQALLVFETETGPIAAIVDSVEAVVKIDEGGIERNPNIKCQVPTEFLIGIANYLGQLVTLIDLNRTLSAEDYIDIQRHKLLAG